MEEKNAAYNGFNHSSPVPRFYKACEKVLLEYLACKGTIHSILNYVEVHHRMQSRVCNFLMQLQSLLPGLRTAVDRSGLLDGPDVRISAAFAFIILGDLIMNGNAGKRLDSKCKPVQAVLSCREKLVHEYDLYMETHMSAAAPPRWVRINTLKTTAAQVREQLLAEGWIMVDYAPNTYQAFLDKLKVLCSGQYMEDFHVKDLLVFPPQTALQNSTLYSENNIIIQNKASCLPVVVSGVCPGMNVVDACSAPGNKSVQLAALMKNRGHLMCVERDTGRYNILKQRMSSYGGRCVEYSNNDFTAIPVEELRGAHTVLVDPSCSNSGVDMYTDDKSVTEERVSRLACMQMRLLSHALRIPGVSAVIYSTCSVHRQENEGVVEEVLAKFGQYFELEDLSLIFKEWRHFGEGPFGAKVLRTNAQVDRCNGFFVAKFVAKFEDYVEVIEEGAVGKEEKKRKRLRNADNEALESVRTDCVDNDLPYDDEVNSVKKKRKKKHRDGSVDESVKMLDDDTAVNAITCDADMERKPKKKTKRRNKENDCRDLVDSSLVAESETVAASSSVHKKRKKHGNEVDAIELLEREAIVDDARYSDKKLKRKKNKNIVDGTEDSVSYCNGDSKKKLKKRKRKDVNDYSDCDTIGDNSADQNDVIYKKVKRGDKVTGGGVSELNCESDAVASVINPKKKKKKHVTE